METHDKNMITCETWQLIVWKQIWISMCFLNWWVSWNLVVISTFKRKNCSLVWRCNFASKKRLILDPIKPAGKHYSIVACLSSSVRLVATINKKIISIDTANRFYVSTRISNYLQWHQSCPDKCKVFILQFHRTWIFHMNVNIEV